MGTAFILGGSCDSTEPPHCLGDHTQRSENALDALLDELQTFSRPASQLSQTSSTSTHSAIYLVELGRSKSHLSAPVGRAPKIAEISRNGSVDSPCSNILTPTLSSTLHRLHSYSSSSKPDTSPDVGTPVLPCFPGHSDQNNLTLTDVLLIPPKPPIPERNAELLQMVSTRRVPPPPPPRTSSRSPMASPTSPQLPPRNPCGPATILRRGAPLVKAFSDSNHKPNSNSQAPKTSLNNNIASISNSSSCESVNSQEGLQSKKERQEQLEHRHQELLRKQKALQEQYARLQQLQRNASGCTATVSITMPDILKKTGSESNLLAKMGLSLTTSTASGSLTSLTNNKTNKNFFDGLQHTSSVNKDDLACQAGDEDSTTATSNSISIMSSAKVYATDIL